MYNILILAFVIPTVLSLHCLVVRPGYGLVTEKCPHGSVGCRIRISRDAVDFYEYSALYDRNQYVCVHKAEFDEAKQSGCLRKKSGRVRCWCYGRSNCNTAEASKDLYEAFISDDKDYFHKVIKEIDSSPPVTDFSPATTPHPSEIVKVPIISKSNGGGMLRGGSSPKGTSGGSGAFLLSEDDGAPFVRHPGSRKVEGPNKPQASVNDLEGGTVFSKSTIGKKPEEHKLRHHHYRTETDHDSTKRLTSSRGTFSNKQPEQVQRSSMLVSSNPPTTLRPIVPTQTPKPQVLSDKNKDIQVITVGVQDQYDLQNADVAMIKEPRTLPTEVASEDLYDDEELARLDRELAEQQRKQNRPAPVPEAPMEAIRVLPQEDDDVGADIPETHGEYFDSTSASSAMYSNLSLLIILLIQVL